MSVDEIAWKKGHSYVTNVVDIDRRAVIWNHQDRGKKVLELLHCKKRFILLRNKPSGKKDQVLSRLEKLNEPVYKTMLLKEQFATIYEYEKRKMPNRP